MKIRAIEPFLFNAHTGRNLLLVRVETSCGIHGWGECYVSGRKEVIVESYVRQIADYLIGRSPLHSRHHWRIIFDDFGIRRSTLDLSCAWSGIEIALWDIAGKAAGMPIHHMLGGAQRNRVKVYANGWADGLYTVDAICRSAEETVKRGFSALKWDPYSGPWRTFISKSLEDAAVENVRAVRQVVGPKVDLLIDAHRRVSPNQALSFARRVEEFGILQLEDPSLADNITLVAETRQGTTLPIVIGETLFTKEHFAQVFAHRACDIINPDVGIVGGILPMLEIAAMAEPHAIGLSPHSNLTTVVGAAATAQVSAMATNFVIAEYFVSLEEASHDIALSSLHLEDGAISLSEAPGLGVDVAVDKLKARPFAEPAAQGFRQYWEE